MDMQGGMKGKKVTPVVGVGIVRKTPIKRTMANTEHALMNGSGGKMRKMGGPLTPSRINNEANGVTVTKGPVPKEIPIAKTRGRNLNAQLNQAAGMDIENSLLSINEDDFQAPLGERENAHSTFIHESSSSPPHSSQQGKHVTVRTRGRAPTKPTGGARRRSRSCTDLATGLDMIHLHVPGHLPIIRSNPCSPMKSANQSSTPGKLPRFGVAQRKRPFMF